MCSLSCHFVGSLLRASRPFWAVTSAPVQVGQAVGLPRQSHRVMHGIAHKRLGQHHLPPGIPVDLENSLDLLLGLLLRILTLLPPTCP